MDGIQINELFLTYQRTEVGGTDHSIPLYLPNKGVIYRKKNKNDTSENWCKCIIDGLTKQRGR